MENTEYQLLKDENNRNAAEICRNAAVEKSNAAEISRNAADSIRSEAEAKRVFVNMAQINVQAVVLPQSATYKNGPFIPVFQDALKAFACNEEVKPGTRRVLEYILGSVDENNCFSEELCDIATNLRCSEDTVERAIKQLVAMHIICKKAGARDRSIYELSDKNLNPRLAFKGNTKNLRKEILPILLEPNGLVPLLPDYFNDPQLK